MNRLGLLVLILSSAACSDKDVYNAVQGGQTTECQPLYGAEYDRCMQRYSKPFDEYLRERQEVLEDSSR